LEASLQERLGEPESKKEHNLPNHSENNPDHLTLITKLINAKARLFLNGKTACASFHKRQGTGSFFSPSNEGYRKKEPCHRLG
jgi:hypothetical protein